MHKGKILLALLFISTVVSAQQAVQPPFQSQEKTGYVSLSYGPSFPVGKFSSKGLSENDAGIAGNGRMLEGTMAVKMGKYIGIMAYGCIQTNPVDIDAIVEQYNRAYPNISWSGGSGSWNSKGLMAGFFSSFPFANGNSSLELRALFGYMTTSSPAISVTGSEVISQTGGSVSATASQSSVDDGEVGVLLGAGYKYNLGSFVALLVNLSYYATTPKFTDVKTIIYSLSYPVAYGYSSFEQPVKTINITFGVAILID